MSRRAVKVHHPAAGIEDERGIIEALLDFGAQCFEFGLAALFALFDQPQPLAHDFACRGVATALDQAFDQALEVFADAVAACHGRVLEYQYMIFNAVHDDRKRIFVGLANSAIGLPNKSPNIRFFFWDAFTRAV